MIIFFIFFINRFITSHLRFYDFLIKEKCKEAILIIDRSLNIYFTFIIIESMSLRFDYIINVILILIKLLLNSN